MTQRSIKNLTFSTWTWRETCSSLERKPTELTTKRWMQNAKNMIKIIVLRQVYIAKHIFPKFLKFYRLRVVSTSRKRVGESRARGTPQTHQLVMRQTRDVRWAIFPAKIVRHPNMQSLLILICNLALTLVLKLCYAISDFPSSCPAYLTK